MAERPIGAEAKSSHARRRLTFLIVLGAAIIAGFALFFWWYAETFGSLEGLTPEGLQEYLRGFGLVAPALFLLLFVIQGVLAPVPAPAFILAAGLLWGVGGGFAVSWVGQLGAASACFVLSRVFGKGFVERLVGPSDLARVDAYMRAHGVRAILILRLIPLISFDLVSYAGGLVRMRYRDFLLATAVGSTPVILALVILGERVAPALDFSASLIIFIAGIAVTLLALKFLVFDRLLQTPAPNPSDPKNT